MPTVPVSESVRAPWLQRVLLLALGWLCLSGEPARGAEEAVFVRVTDPYLELRTGPASEFPIFYVAERGERVEILMRRTDWFKVRIERGKEGWVSREQMEHTLTDAGVPVSFRDVLVEDYLRRRIYVGVAYGRFEKDPIYIARIGYQLGKNFAIELARAQAVGSFTTTELTQLNLVGSPVTDSRWLPYMTLGFGPLNTAPAPTLVNAPKVNATAGNAGIGVQYYLTRNFVARADYRRYAAPLDENRVGKYREWSLGLSAFF